MPSTVTEFEIAYEVVDMSEKSELVFYAFIIELLQLVSFEIWLQRQLCYICVEMCAACRVMFLVATKIGRGTSRQWSQ
jgi:hypothetical protein